MTRKSKRALLLVVVIVCFLGAEFAREKIVYLSATRRLEHAYWNIRPGMTREDVVKQLGAPTFSSTESGHDDLYWSAARFQGFLLRGFRAPHYTINVSFGPDDRVVDVESSIN